MKEKELEKEWWRFLKLCTEMKTPQQLDHLFDLFFTPGEHDDIAMRLALVKELLAGRKTQREIAADLGVSIAKITRGANALKKAKPSLKKQIEAF